MKYTTQTLLDRIAVKAALPAGQETYTPEEILDLANQELLSTILPEILRTREDYYLTSDVITVGNNVGLYDMPERAIAGKVNDIQVVDDNNRVIRSLPRITTAQINERDSGDVSAFYFQGAYIGLHPAPSSEQKLKVSYYARPSSLVLPEKAYEILSMGTDEPGEYIQVDRPIKDLGRNDKVDISKGTGLYQTLNRDEIINQVDGDKIYLVTRPEGLKEGDYISPAGQSLFVQCPSELYPWLEELVVVKLHESNGDFDAMKLAQKKADLIRDQILSLLSPRAETEAQIITNTIWRQF